MKKVHDVMLEHLPPPNDLRQFAFLLAHFPLTFQDWLVLLQNKEYMQAFINEGKDLPPELFKILSCGLQAYHSNNNKLILLMEKSSTGERSGNNAGCFRIIAQPKESPGKKHTLKRCSALARIKTQRKESNSNSIKNHTIKTTK